MDEEQGNTRANPPLSDEELEQVAGTTTDAIGKRSDEELEDVAKGDEGGGETA